MEHPLITSPRALVFAFACLLVRAEMPGNAAEPLHVCATVPDLADLARIVGGDAVTVETLIGGMDDPHEVHPRPGFVKALARAQLLVTVGAELEVDWLPALLTQSRNARIGEGSPGYFAAASAVQLLGIIPLGAPAPAGHVHLKGNPHFMTDPVCGVQVAAALARRVGDLVPDHASECQARYHRFVLLVAQRLLGPAILARVGDERACAALEHDDIGSVVDDAHDLGGWLADLRPALGAEVIADHDLWPYLAKRFHVVVLGWLEPDPEVAPTAHHLIEIIELAKARKAQALITVPFFNQHMIELVADKAALPVIHLAHQVGAAPEAVDWLSMVAYNVHALAKGLIRSP